MTRIRACDQINPRVVWLSSSECVFFLHRTGLVNRCGSSCGVATVSGGPAVSRLSGARGLYLPQTTGL